MIVDMLTRKPPANRRRRQQNAVVEIVSAARSRLPSRTRVLAGESDVSPDLVEAPRVILSRVGAWVAALVCLALIVGVGLSFGQYTSRTQRFVVSDFEVSGNNAVSHEQVVAATGVELGTPLLAVAPNVVQDRLKALPWIKNAEVKSILPSRLLVRVQEYVPVAMVAAGDLWLVDHKGTLFDRVRPEDGHDLPMFTGLRIDALLPGAKSAGDTALVQRGALLESLALLAGVSEWTAAKRFDLGEIHWDAAQGASLISALDGAEVRLGHDALTDLPRRLDRLGRLLIDVERRGERLRYALMDDARRPERATVNAIPHGAKVALPGMAERKAGGAASPSLPEAARKSSRNHTNTRPRPRASNARRGKPSPDPTEPGA